MQDDRRLQLVVTPLAAVGHDITAVITATNVPETVLTVHAPDTVVIEGPKKEVVGPFIGASSTFSAGIGRL